ncbi:MAG: hypothetical protein JWN29_4036, partial [Acidimicrobiales bacterium]|nr:hypothetical protein [Acidimicrobiales bacterium]
MESVLDDLDEVLDRLTASTPSSGDEVVRLHHALARLDAITTQAVGRWDAAKTWATDRAKSGAAWLTARCRTPAASARRRVYLARALRDLSHTEQAWLDGAIDSAHVSLLSGARTERTAVMFDRDEGWLVDQARTMRFSHFTQTLAYWLQHADPDGADQKAQDQRNDRRFDLSQTFQGTWVGDLVLDPIGGTILATSLKQIESELFRADWAEAKDQLGRDPLVTELRRTPKQRRADALVEMAVRARTAPRDGRRPAPLFSVLVGYETFHGRMCELANGTVLTPQSLVPWLDEASIDRIVFDGPSRVIDVGVERRLFEGATRRAVEMV